MESRVIVAPRSNDQKLSVFKLHKNDNINWSEAKMKRENSFQPWQIKLGTGRSAKRFKAIKEGGVGENASYFIFYKPTNSTDDTYEVSSIDEWYNVSATQRYKTLTAEEAEQQFEQRHRTLNYFSVMHNKKSADDGIENSSSFKLTEMEDWDNPDDDSSSSDKDIDDEKNTKKKKSIKKDEDDGAPQEGKEDSDEGDFENREVDYMSDTSSESADEEALRDMISTDDEDDDEVSPTEGAKSSDKKSIIATDTQQDPTEESSDSDDYDVDDEKMDSMFKDKSLPMHLFKQEAREHDTGSTSGAAIPATNPQQASKRKLETSQASTSAQPQPTPNPPKRPCPVDYSSSAPPNSHEKVVEDLIKKYLSRKPMTLRTLLKDIKNKLKRMGGAASEMDSNLVNMIASIINRIKPERQKINDTIYLSLKA